MENFDEIIDLQQDENFEPDYADFGERLVALLVDSIILTLLFGFSFFVLIFINASVVQSVLNYTATLTIIFIFLGIPILTLVYHAYFESSRHGGSPGKILLKIRVTDLRGRRISFMHSIGRNAGKILSQMIFYIGYLMVLWSPRKQSLHDNIANTLVIRNKHETIYRREEMDTV
ncbi:MAG: RDD family protein [Saprospiraceae bacterium]